VRSAVFQRLASPPSWARGFYADRARSGGALVDLHIHDADFVRHLFGNPIQVDSSGDSEHVTTLYRFADGPQHVVAEGGWDHHAPWPFQMRYTVIFERATASFDVQREPKLIVYRADRAEPVELPKLTGYDGEIRHVLDLVAGARLPARASAADGYAVARLLEAEQRSASSRRPVRLSAGVLPPGTFMSARAARRRRSPRAGGR
jgi:predicted dehydrogenase